MKKDKFSIVSFAILLVSFITAAVFLIVSIITPKKDASQTDFPDFPADGGVSSESTSEILDESSESSSEAESSVPESSSEAESSAPESSKPIESSKPVESSKPQTETSSAVEEYDTSYLDDALFIGDSRTQGLSYYGGIKNATFFATQGLNITRVLTETTNISGIGKTNLSGLLQKKSFGKIYIMLGINELGWMTPASIKPYYTTLIETIRAAQPDAVIFVSSCIHVTKAQSSKGGGRTNANIDKLNAELKTLEDGAYVFYLDPNPIFDDGNGNLKANLSGDGIHLYAKCYKDLTKWLCEDALG